MLRMVWKSDSVFAG